MCVNVFGGVEARGSMGGCLSVYVSVSVLMFMYLSVSVAVCVAVSVVWHF